MWRTIFFVVLLAVLQTGCTHSDTRSNARSNTRSGTFDVRAYGAKGDGETIDTPAINQAIIAANAAGGGTVYLPAGNYLCYSIRLKSNVDLYLDRGCTIVAANAKGEEGSPGYDAPEPNAWDRYEDFGHSHWRNSLIWGDGLENISILGPGLIWGKGLSKGDKGRIDPTTAPSTQPTTSPATAPVHDVRDTLGPTPSDKPRDIGRTPYPKPRDSLRDGIGNKSIALKNCRNVLLRDFSVLHGGHFALLATGVDNLTIDNVKVDTNRDGFDIDCCRNVRISNCSINSPWDDAICLKSCYGLGFAKSTEDVTITNCYVTGGFHEGTLLNAKFERFPSDERAPRTGRIKFGTESNGGFKRITISNCVLDYSGGLAIESVDGAIIEDVTISNLVLRDITTSPIFIRLGNRARGPDYPAPGAIRRINISDILCSNANWRYGSIISGIPGYPIEDVRISNVRIAQQGGGGDAEAAYVPPEMEDAYPEPSMFGTMPSSMFFIRHVKNLRMSDSELLTQKPDARPPFILDDVAGIEFSHMKVRQPAGVPVFKLRGVSDFVLHHSFGMADTNEPTTRDGSR